MKPVNIENLSDLLQRIWSGELEHHQDTFFCGSACCLAGWDVVLNSGVTKTTSERENSLTEPGEAGDPYSDPWVWSTENNGLTKGEALLMYHRYATKQLHRATLNALKAGRRFDPPDHPGSWHLLKLSISIKPFLAEGSPEMNEEYYKNGTAQVGLANEEELERFREFIDPSGQNPNISFHIDDDSTCVTVFSDV